MTRPMHDGRGVLPEREEPVGTVLERTCIGCGEDYQWTSTEGFQWPTQYCTRRCKRQSSVRRRQRLTDPGEATEGQVLLFCSRCGDPFAWTPRTAPGESSDRPPVYCSQTCQLAIREKRKKEARRLREEARTERRENAAELAARQADEEHAAKVSAISAAARELLLPVTHCLRCNKVASPTEQAAKDAKRGVEARTGRTNEVRYYQCGDGWWHWTSWVDGRPPS